MKNKIKPILFSHSDIKGGAALATYRLNNALREANVDSYIKVRKKYTNDSFVVNDRFGNVFGATRSLIGRMLTKFQVNNNNNYHSLNLLPSRWSKAINNSDFDIVNIHWVGAETISIKDIGSIQKPVVMTLHDMWGFCGSEHVVEYKQSKRYREGYTFRNSDNSMLSIDWDRIVWNKKRKYWNKNIIIVTPSRWLATQAKESKLFRHNKVVTIPNIVNLDIFRPLEKACCRRKLNIPIDKKVIVFGAINSTKNENKGYSLLIESLSSLSNMLNKEDVVCLVFGANEPENNNHLPFDTHWLGHIDKEEVLAEIYNCGDVFVIPSRVENLPQTATEAQSCGIPVVGFDTTGVPDAVSNGQTGLLATPYNTEHFAKCIYKILENDDFRKMLSISARLRAEKYWNKNEIVDKYKDTFYMAIKGLEK